MKAIRVIEGGKTPKRPVRPQEGDDPAGQFTLPYSNPTTSFDAAQSMENLAPTLRMRVYAFICEQGARGATDEEIQTALGMKTQTETPRRLELVEGGLVVESEEKRRTRSGRWAIVWRKKEPTP